MATIPPLGALARVDPREIWKHEAHDFTPWLADHVEGLESALGIEIEITGSEHPVGGFSLDLVGRDLSHDAPLIIENQLEQSDHTHLGQLLTYAAGTGAATIVWIATSIRDEHRQALMWLNEQTDVDTHFFGVELEVVRIGDSLPAPLFNVVVLPNDWQKSLRAAAAGVASGKALLYGSFWGAFLTELQLTHPTWSKSKNGTQASWFPMSVGAPAGCLIMSGFAAGGKLRHELYINRASPGECKALFDWFEDRRDVFEAAYGRKLTWERLEERKACRIAEYRTGAVENSDEHSDYIRWFLDAGARLRNALAAIGPIPASAELGIADDAAQ